MAVLDAKTWRYRELLHHERTDHLTFTYRQAREQGKKHPVEDFLYHYYSLKPSHIRRWHAGSNNILEEAHNTERAQWRWYKKVKNGMIFDTETFMKDRGDAVRFIYHFITRTMNKEARFGCFGLHEWAMVYKQDKNDIRHLVPLRLGSHGTNEVVESHQLNCSHFDAFRFYTPEAKPRNKIQPTRITQINLDQPGCLHVGMDLYKWAYKLGPLLPGELLLDCFELAREIRILDMKASPYDLTPWGYEPLKIETTNGKNEYVTQQKAFTIRSQRLRHHLLEEIDKATLQSFKTNETK